MLRWMEATAGMGWFISDLHRDPVPYHLYRGLSKMLRFHRFVRHDGPVSIRRAFQIKDWQTMLAAAKLTDEATIYSAWPARLCVSRVKSNA